MQSTRTLKKMMKLVNVGQFDFLHHQTSKITNIEEHLTKSIPISSNTRQLHEIYGYLHFFFKITKY